jgi:glycerol-3-phosphate dehydrogenase (NAD(P)+)
LLVTPAQFVRGTLKALKAEITDGKPVVICSKGIEISTGLMMVQVAEEEVPGATIAILTGPTFARESANGLPSAVTIAAKDKDVAQEIRDVLATRALRPYITDDVIGAELGGAIKNVIAIACGMVIGKGLGESARAALLSRGLAEMSRLGSAMGANKDTFSGMCGIGDLVLTATSMQSRNFSFGVAFGEGKTTEQILGSRNAVTEGFYTAEALTTLARNQAVDMPICQAVFDCLSGTKTLDDGIADLLDRPLKNS